jgi:hypothetical protein
MQAKPSAQELGAQIAAMLLLHAYDTDDAPTTFANVTLVYDALQHATSLVKEQRATLVRRALDHVERRLLPRFFGAPAGVINFILRSLPKGASSQA